MKIYTVFIYASITLCLSCNQKQIQFSDQPLKKTEGKSIFSGPLAVNLSREFIIAYKGAKIPAYTGAKPVKGFYLDKNVINAINMAPAAEGVFLYLAKKVQPHGDEYTLIAIPSIASVTDPLRDSLLLNRSMEWHDPITTAQHKPVNELEIGYLTTE